MTQKNNSEVVFLDPPEIELQKDPGYGLGERNALYTIAARLLKHTAGTIAGKSGKVGTSKVWDKGTLTMDEALYVTQYAISRGLNPFGDVHIWFYKKIMVTPDYKIIAGWAQMRESYTSHLVPVNTSELREEYGVGEKDVAQLCYIVKASQERARAQYFSTIVQAQTAMGKVNIKEAKHQALEMVCSPVIGIVRWDEMTDKNGNFRDIQVTGKNWEWRAGIRALRGALSQSHGEPTVAEIQQYSQAQYGGRGISPEALAHPDYDPNLPEQAQQKLLGLIEVDNRVKQEQGRMTPDERQRRFKRNTSLLRGEEDPFIGDEPPPPPVPPFPQADVDEIEYIEVDDDGTPFDQEPAPDPDPTTVDVSPDLEQLRQTLRGGTPSMVAKYGGKEASSKQIGLLKSKLEEVFAGPDARHSRKTVLCWLFSDIDPLFQGKQAPPDIDPNFAQAHAVLEWLISGKDEDTNDYTFNSAAIDQAKRIFHTVQKARGQLSFFD